MTAYYYAIKTKLNGHIVLEGVLRNSEDTIYPAQETGIEELPYECEAHHFKANDYILEGYYFEIEREDVFKHRV